MENQKILVLEPHVSCTSGIMTKCGTLIAEIQVRPPARAYIHYKVFMLWGCDREFTDKIIGNNEKVLVPCRCSNFRVNGCEIGPEGSLEVVLSEEEYIRLSIE